MQKWSERASELVEYSHNIHTIAETYTWKNVYQYDKEFRIHMERNPERNWGVILQRVWSLCLRDKLSSNNFDKNGYRNGDSQSIQRKNNKICYKYNGGCCTYGFNCKFQHKCGICNKFGHGAHLCRRASGGNNSKWNPDNSFQKGKDHEVRDDLIKKRK